MKAPHSRRRRGDAGRAGWCDRSVSLALCRQEGSHCDCPHGRGPAGVSHGPGFPGQRPFTWALHSLASSGCIQRRLSVTPALTTHAETTSLLHVHLQNLSPGRTPCSLLICFYCCSPSLECKLDSEKEEALKMIKLWPFVGYWGAPENFRSLVWVLWTRVKPWAAWVMKSPELL